MSEFSCASRGSHALLTLRTASRYTVSAGSMSYASLILFRLLQKYIIGVSRRGRRPLSHRTEIGGECR